MNKKNPAIMSYHKVEEIPNERLREWTSRYLQGDFVEVEMDHLLLSNNKMHQKILFATVGGLTLDIINIGEDPNRNYYEAQNHPGGWRHKDFYIIRWIRDVKDYNFRNNLLWIPLDVFKRLIK